MDSLANKFKNKSGEKAVDKLARKLSK